MHPHLSQSQAHQSPSAKNLRQETEASLRSALDLMPELLGPSRGLLPGLATSIRACAALAGPNHDRQLQVGQGLWDALRVASLHVRANVLAHLDLLPVSHVMREQIALGSIVRPGAPAVPRPPAVVPTAPPVVPTPYPTRVLELQSAGSVPDADVTEPVTLPVRTTRAAEIAAELQRSTS